MTDIDRRSFLATGTAFAARLFVPCIGSMLSPAMAEAVRDLEYAIGKLDAANEKKRRDWARYEATGLLDNDGFWDWYMQRDTSRRYNKAWKKAQEIAEHALMIPAATTEDEDALMKVLDTYAQISGSSFATQVARDLFTPRRYQTYPHDRIRYWLLTDPEEDFEKTGMPGFLRQLREVQAQLV